MDRYSSVGDGDTELRRLNAVEHTVEWLNCKNDGLANFGVFAFGSLDSDEDAPIDAHRVACALSLLQRRHGLLHARVARCGSKEDRLTFVESEAWDDIALHIEECATRADAEVLVRSCLDRTHAQMPTWRPSGAVRCHVINGSDRTVVIGLVAAHVVADAVSLENLLHELLLLVSSGEDPEMSPPPVPVSAATCGRGPFVEGMRLPADLRDRAADLLASERPSVEESLAVEADLLACRIRDDGGVVVAAPAELLRVQRAVEAAVQAKDVVAPLPLDGHVPGEDAEARKLLVDTHVRNICVPAGVMGRVVELGRREGLSVHAILGAAFLLALAQQRHRDGPSLDHPPSDNGPSMDDPPRDNGPNMDDPPSDNGPNMDDEASGFNVATPINLRKAGFNLRLGELGNAAQPLFAAIPVSRRDSLLEVARAYGARCSGHVRADRHVSAWFAAADSCAAWRGCAAGMPFATFSNVGRATVQRRYAGLPVQFDRIDIPLALHGGNALTVELITFAGACHVTLSYEVPTVADSSAETLLARMVASLEAAA